MKYIDLKFTPEEQKDADRIKELWLSALDPIPNCNEKHVAAAKILSRLGIFMESMVRYKS